MKRILILTCFMTSLCIIAKPSAAFKKEYANLVSQCSVIAARILQENSFEPIKQQALAGYQNTMVSIQNRLGKGIKIPIASNIQVDLDALEAQHNARILVVIQNTIVAYLNTIGTPAAKKLLADIIAGNPLTC